MTTMSLFPRRLAAPPQPSRSMSSSDNSHTSESAVSQPNSRYSSSTSSGTHFRSISPLPKGAKPPQVNLPVTEYDLCFHPRAKRKPRLLRKPHPPPSISNPSVRNGNLFYMANRGPPSRSGRVPIGLNDTASFPDINRCRPLFADSVLPPTPFYEVSRHSRSLDEGYESRAIDRPIPPAEHAAHVFGTLTRSTDGSERLHMKVAHVKDSVGSHEIPQIYSDSRTSTMIKHSLAYRNKPLPSVPGHSPSYNGLASSKSAEALPSHNLLPDVHLPYPLPSENGQPQINHFVRPNVNPGHKRYAQTDVGHAQTWFDSGLSSACSDTQYGISEPQSRHSTDIWSPNDPLPFRSLPATTSHSSFAEFVTPPVLPSHATHTAALGSSEPPHAQDTRVLTRGLSWGKRIVRSLSITLFRRNIVADNSVKNLPYSDSDPGHSSIFQQPASVAHSLLALTQHKPQGSHRQRNSRKLRKQSPSLSHSRLSTPAPILTSRSSPALYSHIDYLQEPCGAPSRHGLSEFGTSPEPSSNKKRSRTNPVRYSTDDTSMTRRSGLDSTPPALTAQWSFPRSTTPISSSAKLVKRHGRRRISEGVTDECPRMALPSLRTQSHTSLDFIPPAFSDASRSRSAPNLKPIDSTSRCFVSSPYVTFPTGSPASESPHARESPVGESLWSEYNRNPPQPQDLPALLHSGFNRRWTLAVFDAPEEQLVEELDRLRNEGWGPGFQGELVRVKSKPVKTSDANDQEQDAGPNSEEELEEWLVARKALMVCREIVRTEKSYREGLIKLQRGETLKPPPALLLQYLPALISASLAFSARLDADPSTFGVSAAFLGTEEALEVALVAWSGIVGEFFGAPTMNQRKRRYSDYRILEKEKKGRDKNKKNKNKVAGTPVASETCSDLGHMHDRSTHTERKYIPGNRRSSLPILSNSLTSPTETTSVQQKSWYSPASAAPAAAKLPTVQDLAIQPTQRVMRYVLLYKDLFNSTPTVSPARHLVEQALEGANRIAQRCNRAQDNAAFLT